MEKGRIINLNGGIYKVLMEDNSIIEVKARGKLRNEKRYQVNPKSESKKEVLVTFKNSPKVGDIAYINGSFIDHVEERFNEMVRPDISNVDQIMVVFAAIDIFVCFIHIFELNVESGVFWIENIQVWSRLT